MKANLKQISLVSTFLVSFSFVPVGNSLLASEKKPRVIQQSYPQNFASAFIKDCVSYASEHEGAASFLKPEQLQEVCSCTLDQFQTKYNYSQFQALSSEQKEKEGYACIAQLMFDSKPAKESTQ